jgi:hypothetical protein
VTSLEEHIAKGQRGKREVDERKKIFSDKLTTTMSREK